MPIGTVDYISTLPWNDPANPWPQYFQVSLSAADANLNASGVPLIMQLEEFDPTVGEQNWVYASQNAEGDTVAMTYNSGSNLVTISDGNVGPYYTLETTVRSIPAGWLQGNTNWTPSEGSEENTISIIPVTTYLNPWEYRRRRLLEIV
jgi:hypothetical protein